MGRLNWLAAVIALAAFSAGAKAGLFDRKLSDEGAAGMHRLAIICLLGDELHGRKVGITVFSNAEFDAHVASWNIDSTAAEWMLSLARDGGRFREVALLHPDSATLAAVYSGKGRRERVEPEGLLAFAAAQEFDAVLVLHRNYYENEPFAEPGLTLLNRRAPGLDRTIPCVAGNLRLFNSRTGKVLAYSGSEDYCPRLDLPAGWRESWESYAPGEQSAIEAAFKDTLQRRIRAAFTVMRIGPAAAQ